MLDDQNVLQQRDPGGALRIAGEQYKQTTFEAVVTNTPVVGDEATVNHVVVAGMGGSALAAQLVKSWLGPDMDVSFEIVRGYVLPHYIDERTLVIGSSYSGNTEETVSCVDQAAERGAKVAVIAASGTMISRAEQHEWTYVKLDGGYQPRMAMIMNLRALVKLLVEYGVVGQERYDAIAACAPTLQAASEHWAANVPTVDNMAKHLALESIGKTPVFYGGALTFPVAYKWKISWNENAKNVAFAGELPEFNHNEFIGWTSHPVEKPFVVFDIISSFEHSQILKRFELSDKLLSGKRPKATSVELFGATALEQLLYGCILADFTSIYVAVLNGVNPIPVELVERLKVELG